VKQSRLDARSVGVLAACAAVLFWGLPAQASVRSRHGRVASSARKARLMPAGRTLASPTVRIVRHVVHRGETLLGILRARGLQRRQAAQWHRALLRAAGAIQLLPEHIVSLQFGGGGRLEQLAYDIDDKTRAIVERARSRLVGRTEPLAVTVRTVGAEGVIERNFHRAAVRAGIPDRIISQMADILGWEFDFNRVRRGDRFRVLYERRVSLDGRVLTPGRVLAAEVRSHKHTAQAFYYDDGVEGMYVDRHGRMLAQSFLRYPVEFTRVSSVFSGSRFHPILKRRRPHHGVDFAAPVGTPVRAASDGVVRLAGRNGDFGNQVALDHGKGVITTYSHLHGIVRGIHPGIAVRQGQVIGWVGQTGLATGPHLHFALFRNGKYLNPLTAHLSLRHRVSNPDRFQLTKRTLLTQLASLTRPAATESPVEPIMLAALPMSHGLGPVALTR
jgi:murein DD-endopeptidase MepM/ murein hydrolase activator NlpD